MDRKRKTVIMLFGILMGWLTAPYFFQTVSGLTKVSPVKLLKTGLSFTSKQSTVTAIDIPMNRQIQKDRVNLIHETCHRFQHLRANPGYNKHEPPYVSATRYNISYSKAGKICSTLWTQFFYILLHDGEATKKDVLTKSRAEIHYLMDDHYFKYGVSFSQCNSTRMVVSARNPYSRLFSAYIDRLYIRPVIEFTGENEPICKTSISFPEFLQKIVDDIKKGIYAYHWAPIYYFCKPCEINPAFVIKQETFQNDFLYVLSQTRLEPWKVELFNELVHSEAKSRAFLEVDDVFDNLPKSEKDNLVTCQAWGMLVQRLWNGMQFKGMISEHAPFPSERYKSPNDYQNKNILHEAITGARSRYPLSRQDIFRQRQSAINRFYRTVHPKIIDDIKEVFSVDFEMFGYSSNPPPW